MLPRTRHCPGLIEAFEDEYSSLYEFECFLSVEGRGLAAHELAKLQTRWRDEIAPVEKEVEALRANPGRHRADRGVGVAQHVRGQGQPPLRQELHRRLADDLVEAPREGRAGLRRLRARRRGRRDVDG